VLIGRREDDGRMRYAAVTSCIAMVFQLDAAHVITVEGLSDGEQLNPIQQAMVSCHGAQCGFCTPGFIASLYQMANDAVPMTRENTTRALVGNLCRCTGYDAILCAAERVDVSKVSPLDMLYPPERLMPAADADVLIETPTRRLFVPSDLGAALAYHAENPHATLVAGATDVGVLVNKRVRALTSVLVIGHLREMRSIRNDAVSLVVGAAATLTQLEMACREHLPAFGDFLSWFGSPPIKNSGTLGGNLATGSPIGDSIPALMALSAEVELASVAGTRDVPLNAFYTGYRQTVMRPEELITAIRMPLLRSDERLKLFKVSKRRDLDISSVSVAVFLRMDGEVIEEARVAAGGVGPTVMRLAKAGAGTARHTADARRLPSGRRRRPRGRHADQRRAWLG
jgi:xanthine dehydrogenase small subunit